MDDHDASQAKKRTIYLISGLGADARVFGKLNLPDYELRSLDWIEPYEGESLSDYAYRLSAQIRDKNPVIIGVSFGGMVAAEMALRRNWSRVLLIASVRCRSELPWYYRLAAFMRLHRLLPVKFMLKPGKVKAWFFGTPKKEDRALLYAILRDTNPDFFRWAVRALLDRPDGNAVAFPHIHGDVDRILPVRYVHADCVVRGAGHFLPVTHTEQLAEWIRQQLKVLP